MMKILTVLMFLFTLFASDITADHLYLGQDEKVEGVGLRICLGTHSDLFRPVLLAHYRQGIRIFEIIDDHVPPSNQDKVRNEIEKFYDLVNDSCSIYISSKGDYRLPTIQWILEITNRQFLCLHRPLLEILSSDTENTTFSFSTCSYEGFNPDAPEQPWPQTDTKLIYRTQINNSSTILLRAVNEEQIKHSNDAHIATFITLSEARPFSSELIKDQLPITKIIIDAIQHACLKGEDFWHQEPDTYTTKGIDDPLASQLAPLFELAQQTGFTSANIRYGRNYDFDYLYVPTPKCGWSTMSRATASLEAGRLIDPEVQTFRGFTKFSSHPFHDLLNPTTFKFACVRNPYDKALSGYLDKFFEEKRDEYKTKLGFEAGQEVSFHDFLQRLIETPLRDIDIHFLPSWCTLLMPHVEYDKIVHLENFDEDFQDIMQRLNLPGKPGDYKTDGHATRSSSKLTKHYTKECIKLVQELYKSDFEYFRYPLDPAFPVND